MITVPGGVKNGLRVLLDDEPVEVMSYLAKKAGKGVGICKMTVKKLLSGNVISKTLNSGAKLDVVETESKVATYSYFDDEGQNYMFMDSETYETLPLPAAVLGELGEYINEGAVVGLELYNGLCISLKLREDIILEIVDAKRSAGREDNSAIFELSNGMKKQGPGYLNVGDKVALNPTTFEIWKRV